MDQLEEIHLHARVCKRSGAEGLRVPTQRTQSGQDKLEKGAEQRVLFWRPDVRDVSHKESKNRKVKVKHATVRIGQYTIPLIGIPEDSTKETCDVCGVEFYLGDVVFDGIKFYCPQHEPSRTKKKASETTTAEAQGNPEKDGGQNQQPLPKGYK